MAINKIFKNADSVLLLILGVSFLLHGLVFIFVMGVEIPTGPSQYEYAQWVKKVATPRRDGIVLPPSNPSRDVPDTKESKDVAKIGQGHGNRGHGKQNAQSVRGIENGTPIHSREMLRKQISGAGVLGVIGVASAEGDGEFADVFASSRTVNENVERVMAAKQVVVLPNAGVDLGRGKREDETKGGVLSNQHEIADIGRIAASKNGSETSGKGNSFVNSGMRKETGLQAANVGGGATESLSGTVDRKSVSATISKKMSGFRRCYERGLNGNPELRGKVIFEISIDGDGKVIAVNFVEDSIHSREVLDCVKGILLRIAFAKPEGGLATFKSSLFFEPPK